MRKYAGYVTIVIVMLLSISGCTKIEIKRRTETSRETVREFAKSLKGALQGAMKAGGPLNAIGVCNVVAPEIAKEQSKKYGWQVRRTSLKPRNPANAPDEWEQRVLYSFEKRKAAGEIAAKIEYAEVVDTGGKRQFRYMKAIPTVDICTKCHGVDIAPEVIDHLDKLYPEDKARGFKPGDIRGAFSIIQPM